MGMNLSGKGGYFRFSNNAWHAALQLAREHGWEPAGTEVPEVTAHAPDGTTVDEEATRMERQTYGDWDGDYFYNDGQIVTDEDARNIADALERALELVPEEGDLAEPLLTPAQWQALAWIIHEPFCRVCSAQRKEYECPEKSAYVGHCGSEASEIHLPLFIDETHPHE
jgi:hypothetical protein